MNDVAELVTAIARTGRVHPSHPPLRQIEAFRHFFAPSGDLDMGALDERDGGCTRREVLLRYLVLQAVIDQGPDIGGVREMLVNVTNTLYRREVRFLHRPIDFFKELGLSIDEILTQHEAIKNVRAALWAKDNQSKAEKYNLFMDNSKQVLNFAVFRWGVPLALPLLLEQNCPDDEKKSTALVDYLESWASAEEMSVQLKNHRRYGLGKAIGDKACHLFAKWMVSSFRLTRRSVDPGWSDFSFEVPYDSNAGRVLWRTGYLLHWTDEEHYRREDVVQVGAGKKGTHYLRVTNIRGMGTTRALPAEVAAAYKLVAVQFLRTHKREPQKAEIQRIQHAYLLLKHKESGLAVADFDDGLIHLGTKYCLNHEAPLCVECPIKVACEGYNSNRELIRDYRT